MESPILNMLCQTLLLTLLLVIPCIAGRTLDVDEAIKQILSENDDGAYFSDNTDLDSTDQAVSDLIRRLQPDSEQIDKRIFCNGFRGCRGRGRKRNMPMKQQRVLPEEPPVQKRPFCNGFFGCANGKRSSSRASPRQPIPDELQNVGIQRKRFCNPYGCMSGKRSSLYDTLMSQLRGDPEESDLNILPEIDALTSSESLRLIRDTPEEDLSDLPFETSDFMSDFGQDLPKWCKYCNLVKVILPQLYQYRNQDVMLTPSKSRVMSEAEMSRNPVTSDDFSEINNMGMLSPDYAEQHVDNIKIDKKCNPMSTSQSACTW